LSTKLERLLLDQIREANDRWDLFRPGERLIVGVSGGKDSLSCLRLLSFFNLEMIAVNIDFFAANDNKFAEYCSQYADYLHIISDYLNKDKDNKNLCFSCSKQRKRCLLEAAERHHSTKIVLGHHKNDVVETLLMNQIYSREISTMLPKQELLNGSYRMIRPMYLIPEPLIQTYAREQRIPYIENSCEFGNLSKRSMIRDMLKTIAENSPRIDVIDNIFSSMLRVNKNFLPQ